MNLIIGLILIAVLTALVLKYIAVQQKQKKNLSKVSTSTSLQEQSYEQIDELRRLDIQIAEAFMFYTSIDWQKNYRQPTGIPRSEYDHHRLGSERLREALPRYSTNQADFFSLEQSLMARDVYGLFLQVLAEEGLDATSANLEQKCRAWFKAQTERRKRPSRRR